MKKLLFLLVFISGNVASQTSASVSYGQQSDVRTGALSTVTTLNIKTDVAENLYGDVFVIDKQNISNSSVTMRTELGLTYVKPGNTFSPFFRGALAQKQKSGADTIYYYAVELGVITKVVDGLTIRTGLARRDALSVNDVDFSNELRLMATYSFTKNDSLSIATFRGLSGDAPANTTFIGYSRKF